MPTCMPLGCGRKHPGHHLDENIHGMISKFAGDNKVGGIVDSRQLQQDLDRLGRWGEEWMMEFNTKKCEVLHFGSTDMSRAYTVSGRDLGSGGTEGSRSART